MLTLRKITEDDILRVFEWSNDEDTRKNSFQSETIEWKNHCEWFKHQLENNAFFFIVLWQDEPAGIVRFSIQNETATIGVVIAPNFRGKKLAAPAIQKGCELVMNQFPSITIVAFIKKDNIGSLKSFEKANFRETKQLDVMEHPSIEMTYQK